MTIVIILLGLGVLLLVLDIVFVPGMILGILGGVLIISGVITAYVSLGTNAGHISLSVAIISTMLLLVYAVKTDVWSKFALKTTIASRVNEENKIVISTGDEGIALSALRPIGKAEINGKIVEVRTLGIYCAAGTELIVVSAQNGRICVEPKNAII